MKKILFLLLLPLVLPTPLALPTPINLSPGKIIAGGSKVTTIINNSANLNLSDNFVRRGFVRTIRLVR